MNGFDCNCNPFDGCTTSAREREREMHFESIAWCLFSCNLMVNFPLHLVSVFMWVNHPVKYTHTRTHRTTLTFGFVLLDKLHMVVMRQRSVVKWTFQCVFIVKRKKNTQLKQFNKFHYIFKCTHASLHILQHLYIGRGRRAGICKRERERARNHATIWSNICCVFKLKFHSFSWRWAYDRIPSKLSICVDNFRFLSRQMCEYS